MKCKISYMSKSILRPKTLLFRIISFPIPFDNQLQLHSFNPSSKRDDGKLSVWNEKSTTAEGVLKQHLKDGSLKRVKEYGIVAISVEECEKFNLNLIDDEKEYGIGHISIDFTQLSSKGVKKYVAEYLLEQATIRGWIYPHSFKVDFPLFASK